MFGEGIVKEVDMGLRKPSTWSRAIILAISISLFSWAGAPAANAAENPKVNMNFFRPSVHPGDIMGVLTANQPNHLGWSAGLWMIYNNSPLRLVDSNGTKLYDALNHQFVVDVYGSFNIGGFLDLGLDIPTYLYSKGESPIVGLNLKEAKNASLGDLRFSIKGTFLDRRKFAGFGMALVEDVTFPTSTARNFSGDDSLTSTTFLVADFVKRGWQVALNAGYRVRKDVKVSSATIGDELLLGLGLVVPILCERLEGVGTAEIRTAATDPFADKYKDTMDMMGGIRYRIGNLSLLAAGGGGVLEGYGSPAYRIAFNASWEPKIDKDCCIDDDNDTVCDSIDKCPGVKGTVATGGCPDDDGDMVIGSEDRCPDKPGTKELKGCPDTDKDGIPDIDDSCPNEPGLAKFQGCPDTDNDGIIDLKDKCPKDAGVPALDGCPDKDGDGITDTEDKCPDVAGVKEFAGCPPPRVEVTKEKVVIREMVFFETGNATIKPQSFSLLKEVAKTIKDHPEITKIRVDGHTDSVGTEKINQSLSQRRAESVMKFLVKEGVDQTRLTAKGYGTTKPLADNTTEAGRSQNRRVEFIIVDHGE